MLLTPVVLPRPARVMAECRGSGWRISIVALFMTSSYLLVLFALRSAQVSYVAPARELGIVFGTMLGSVVLREGAAPQRLAGASIIVLGITLPALASSQRVQSRGSHCR